MPGAQSVTFRFRNFSVSKLFQFFDGIGIGFEKFWYRKSIGIGFEKNWYRKSIGIGFKNFCIEKWQKLP